MTTNITASAAYRKGWTAAKRSTDLERSESRFVSWFGETHVMAFIAGWSDYACDEEYGHSFKG